MELLLRYANHNTAHDDLILTFAGQTWKCDSYYLALDSGILPDREDAEKVAAVFRRLLDQWVEALETITDGGVVYLPYDFSDQYTGWLRCRRSGEELEVCRGWAEVEGWSFFPSMIGKYLQELPRFHPEGPAVTVSANEFLQQVRDSIPPGVA